MLLNNSSAQQTTTIYRSWRAFRTFANRLVPRTLLVATESEADQAAARKWLKDFGRNTIPKNLCEISFSRSSGPGGQNVNKYVDQMSSYCRLLNSLCMPE